MDPKQVEQYINERVQVQVQAQVDAQVKAQMEVFMKAHEAARAASGVGMPKPPPPEYYLGDRNAVRINTWIDQLTTYGQFYNLDDAGQLRIAGFYLRGTARDWWANMDSGHKASITSWEAFCHALKGSFYPVDHERRILDQVERLKQVGPVHRYVEKFELLRTQVAGVSDAIWARYFINGLSPPVRIEAIKYEMDHPHTTLPELYRRLTAIGDAMWRAQAMGHRDDPMELTAVVATKAKGKFKARPKSDLTCHACGEKGHFKRECPKLHKTRPNFLNAMEETGKADF